MAVEVGGTTLRDYAGADGNPGYFRQKLFVYERPASPAGSARRRCGTSCRASGPRTGARSASTERRAAGWKAGRMSERILAQLAAADPVMARLIEAVGPFGLVPKAADAPFLPPARARSPTSSSTASLPARSSGGWSRCSIRTTQAFPSPAELLAMPDARLRAAGYSASKIVALEGPLGEGARRHRARHRDPAAARRRRDRRAVHRGARHRPLDRRDDADVPARPARRAAGRRLLRRAQRFPPRLRPAAMPALRALAQLGALAPQRSAAAWAFWRACDLHKAGRLPAPRPAPRVARACEAQSQARPRPRPGQRRC